MITIKLTAEEVRTLDILLYTNPCESACVIGHPPRLPRLDNGRYDCHAMKNGEYICPLQRSIHSIQEKINGGKSE